MAQEDSSHRARGPGSTRTHSLPFPPSTGLRARDVRAAPDARLPESRPGKGSASGMAGFQAVQGPFDSGRLP